ncbi:MAG: hypothetical protein K0S81_531 [Rhodospirillales bacterium]|nr:hypothetical protein [Rhodospirillales bacterium]
MRARQAMVEGVDLVQAGARGQRPTPEQRDWLRRGLDQPGGKLPLFDRYGQSVNPRTIRACIDHGWAEPWFTNPLKPDWLVCKLTAAGRAVAKGEG